MEYSITEIERDQLTAIDLRADAGAGDGRAYRITVHHDAAGMYRGWWKAEALVVGGRIGIAWGAPATWADLRAGVDEAVGVWLTDADEWAARN